MALVRRLRSLRWYDFAPEVLVLGGLTLFAVTEPHAAISGLKSVKAVVLITVVTLVWVAGRVLTAFTVRWPWARIAIFTVGALAILKVVVFPAYDNHTVVEALPAAVPAVPAATSTSSSTPNAGPPASVSGPTKIRDGELVGIDHRAMGTVSLYRTAEGRVLVGLEEFDIQPGPAYVLYLVPGADREDLGGATRLESLRGNRGTQYYETDTMADTIAPEVTVLVWCETFDVPVARATPVAA